MQPIRHIGIPLDHVVAEMAAFPLASDVALRLAPTDLDPQMESPSSQELWRAAERALVHEFPGFLIDELVAIRDSVWFQAPERDASGRAQSRSVTPLHRFLTNLAEQMLEVQGAAAAPKLLDGSSPAGKPVAAVLARRRRAWRWLTFAMPPDLLLAALDPVPDRVNLISPPIDQMLRDRGYAETHLHYGAGMEFSLLWICAQRAAASPEFRSDSLQSPGAEQADGRELAPWLIRALIARYVLGRFLAASSAAQSFEVFLRDSVIVGLVAEGRLSAMSGVVTALNDLLLGQLSSGTTFQELQTAYLLLTGASTIHFPSNIESIDAADTLYDVLPLSSQGRPSTEVRFVRAGLNYLRTPAASASPQFQRLFWQVVRVRTILYRHITQRPLTPGLTWFVRFYGRISSTRRPLRTSLLVESAAKLGGRGEGLRSLEIRTAPSPRYQENLELLEEVARIRARWKAESRRSARPELDCELGVVLHFIKDRGGEAARGVPRAFWRHSHHDPYAAQDRGNPSGYRFAHFFERKMAEANALAYMLRTWPLTLQYLRGLDVCTDEMGVPNWVFAPILEVVRDAAHIATAAVRSQLGKNLPALRTTIHAGEDFIHLQTGLRCVHEAIDQLQLREGDRIGHGVSLGIHPRQWAAAAGRVAMNLEDRLFDLVWEWSWHGSCRGSQVFARQHVLEYGIAELSERLFGVSLPPFRLQQLRQDLCDLRLLRQVGFGDWYAAIPSPRVESRLWPLHRFLTSREVFDRGRELIWVSTLEDAESLDHLQAELRALVGSLGIVVEVNPTSNLLIGNLTDLTNHPMWRLRPPRPAADAPPPVGVCIGSDDPITFSSSLRQEYQCLADAMTLAGLSDEEAAQWLERTRACGLEHRFTLFDVEDRPLNDFTRVSA